MAARPWKLTDLRWSWSSSSGRQIAHCFNAEEHLGGPFRKWNDVVPREHEESKRSLENMRSQSGSFEKMLLTLRHSIF